MLTSLSFSCWYKSNLRFVRLNCLSEAVRQKATIRLEGLASRFLSERPIYKCCNLPFNFIRWSKLYVNLFKIFTITIFGYLIYLTINKIYLVYRSKFSFFLTNFIQHKNLRINTYRYNKHFQLHNNSYR